MSWLSNWSFNLDLENAALGGGRPDGWKNIVHTIQKPSGLILYGNGNEKKRGLTLSVCNLTIQDGIEASLVGLLQDA